MFLRRIRLKKNGREHLYWALVESYRTSQGVRQRIVSYVGDVTRQEANNLAGAIEESKSIDPGMLSKTNWQTGTAIEPKKTRTERQREFGGVWLGLKIFEKLGLDGFFAGISGAKRGRHLADTIKTLILSRFSHPCSELSIAEHFYESSALEDLTGLPPSRVYANRLYRGMDKLLPHKSELERHLKERLGSLFGIQYDLFLYDVTSTYVEGDHKGSELCQRGYSRDGRPDCKQVCIALVVTREGLPLGYEIFSGNTHDSRTVEVIVEKMEEQYGKADRIWVMDRGMVSEKNLDLLRQKGRKYIIGTPKSSLRKMEKDILKQSDWQAIRGGVEVKMRPSPEHAEEVYILCKSQDRAKKEEAMHERFIKRIGDGLGRLEKFCQRSKGKDVSRVVERRVGRLLQENSRGAGFFHIETDYDKKQGLTILKIEKKDSSTHWQRITEGHYLLRSNIKDWGPRQLWEAYIHLTDAEDAFRIHKSDLLIRPLWHQKDERIKAHILICFLAFGLMCMKAGLGDEPRRVFKEIKKICMADVVLTTIDGRELRVRSVIRPDKACQVLLNRLRLRLPVRLEKRDL